jgi:branched-chain amino acid transport system substrate-binding protein
MSDNKDIVRLAIAVVIASGILGIGLVGLQMATQETKVVQPTVSPTDNLVKTPNSTTTDNSENLSERMSFGEKILVEEELARDRDGFKNAKIQGQDAMARKNYQEATTYFTKALKIASNAPETLIYLNNAKIGEAEAYIIAVPVPIIPQKSGNKHPDKALEMLRGFAQAQDEINRAGGINGKPLKLLIVNDDDKPEIAVKIAEQLLKDKKVIGVMGHRLSEVSLVTAPIYTRAKIVFVTPVSTSPALQDEDKSVNNGKRYVFRTNIDTESAAKKLASYVLSTLKVKDVAIFYDSQKPQYSQNLRKEFKSTFEAFQGKIVYEADLSSVSENFPAETEIQQAIAKGAKAFILLPNINSVENARSIIATTPKNINLIGDISVLYTRSTLSFLGEKAEGMVLAVASHNTKNTRFANLAKQLWGGDNLELSWQTVNSYDAAQIFIEALRRNPQPEAIQEEICKQEFAAIDAAGNKLSFDCSVSSTPLNRVKLVRVSRLDSNPKEFHFKLLNNQ